MPQPVTIHYIQRALLSESVRTGQGELTFPNKLQLMEESKLGKGNQNSGSQPNTFARQQSQAGHVQNDRGRQNNHYVRNVQYRENYQSHRNRWGQ
jgi:hypothetical protein